MNKKIIAGIDIGSSKITTLIASAPEIGLVNIMGVSTNQSRGIRKGQIVDIEEATSGVVQSLEAAERMAGYSISSAFFCKRVSYEYPKPQPFFLPASSQII